ncbi:putative FBD-associated F-box protein At5g38570 [Setaria italica]|nr:putative FBD-associated F-box protein At5g38570 [Setaria italica]XP_034604718.1 MEIOTIC F-BOX protein MOF-like [Setaria viridis]
MVHTCELSRRWRHLWAKVPRLDIDQHEFTDAVAGYKKFGDFVHFLLQKVSIALLDELRLHVHSGYILGSADDDNASAWIRRAIMSSAQEPQREGVLNSGSWRLKTLHLSNLRHLDELFAEHVRSRCPSLEHLELRVCTCQFHAIASGSLKSLALKCCTGKGFYEITSPTLRSLVVERGDNDSIITSPFVVTAPALACLSLDISPYNFPGGVSFGEMASLARASIHLLTHRETLAKEKHLRDHLFKTLRSVSNAASLELSGFDITVEAGEESTAFPEFNNLRNLELNKCGLCDDLQVSGRILRNSPNLEKLTLHLSPSWKVLVGEPLSSYPEFKNIRVLILHNYDPSDDFQTLLGCFLRSSPILEKLTLRCCKFLNDTKKRRGTSKMKNVVVENLVDVRCENLKHTEIIYKDDDVRQLVEFLLLFSRNLPNNNIRLTKVD